MLKFIAPLILVEDLTRSRQFYEQVLGQTVKFDFGEDIQFEGDFSIHFRPHFQRLLGGENAFPVTRKANWGEFYFETDEIEAVEQRLREAGVEVIHPIHEQPWGERVIRVYDPDGHILEIGESLEAAARRFYRDGQTTEWIMEKIGMPREFVEQAISQQ
ncbi:glyoxalase/bleomycin resistance/dioxygenase family protein [Leptolinea sp. HRD-7]|nr:glyoxalase/bleomycin resistance/dioxygenase family protein [Leptolinea sp. HRD-7]